MLHYGKLILVSGYNDMKKIELILLFIAFQLHAVPKIACDDPIYSFGKVNNGKTLEHIFIIKNIGDTDLIIGRIKGCCGTTVMCSNKRVAPDDYTMLNVKLSFKGRRGSQRKTIYVKSNDPDKQYYALTLAGEVYTGIFSDKQTISFDGLKQDSLQHASSVISSLSNIDFSITNVSIDADYLQASFSKVKANKYIVDINTVPPIKKQMNVSHLKIFTDNTEYPYITVPVTTSVLQDIMVMPSKVKISKTPFYKSFVLRSKSGKKIKILNVEMPIDGMSYEVSPLRTSSYRLVVKGNVLPEKLIGKMIVIKTDAPENPDVGIELL